MNAITRDILKTIERDESLTSAERDVLRRLRKGEVTVPTAPDRILRRREVAERCACGLRTIDRWCTIGLLPRMKLPGFQRASGIPESAVNALIANGTVTISGKAYIPAKD